MAKVIDYHTKAVGGNIEKKFKEYFPTAKMTVDINEESKIFQIGCEFVSRKGKIPILSMHLQIVIMAQINQFSFDMIRIHRQSVFPENIHVDMVRKFNDTILNYTDCLKLYFDEMDVDFQKLNQFIKLVVSETDLYYTLSGISVEQREARFRADIKKMRDASKQPKKE